MKDLELAIKLADSLRNRNNKKYYVFICCTKEGTITYDISDSIPPNKEIVYQNE